MTQEEIMAEALKTEEINLSQLVIYQQMEQQRKNKFRRKVRFLICSIYWRIEILTKRIGLEDEMCRRAEREDDFEVAFRHPARSRQRHSRAKAGHQSREPHHFLTQGNVQRNLSQTETKDSEAGKVVF